MQNTKNELRDKNLLKRVCGKPMTIFGTPCEEYLRGRTLQIDRKTDRTRRRFLFYHGGVSIPARHEIHVLCTKILRSLPELLHHLVNCMKIFAKLLAPSPPRYPPT